jgi:hypothetical protein
MLFNKIYLNLKINYLIKKTFMGIKMIIINNLFIINKVAYKSNNILYLLITTSTCNIYL